MNEACHIYEWGMPHMWIRHVPHVNEACHVYEGGRSRIRMKQVTHMNEAYPRIWVSHDKQLCAHTEREKQMESYKWNKINHKSVSRQSTSRAHSTKRGWNCIKKIKKLNLCVATKYYVHTQCEKRMRLKGHAPLQLPFATLNHPKCARCVVQCVVVCGVVWPQGV